MKVQLKLRTMFNPSYDQMIPLVIDKIRGKTLRFEPVICFYTNLGGTTVLAHFEYEVVEGDDDRSIVDQLSAEYTEIAGITEEQDLRVLICIDPYDFKMHYLAEIDGVKQMVTKDNVKANVTLQDKLRLVAATAKKRTSKKRKKN